MITRQYHGEDKPLKKVLPSLFSEISYSELCATLRRKDVKIGGKRVADGSLVVREGEEITIYPKKKKQIVVVYEDDNILVVNKPKGIPSQGEVSFETSVKSELGEELVLMHRLDTNTDGLLLFAKNSETERELYAAMKSGSIAKGYRAEVYGHPRVYEDTVLRYYYKKSEAEKRAYISESEKAGYLPVELTFRVTAEKERTALLYISLHKGKMHQIRAMLAYYGYFIVGDGKYGNDSINKELGVKRHLLTAVELSFHLPKTSPLSYLNDITISL